jgi:hypothetical protein
MTQTDNVHFSFCQGCLRSCCAILTGLSMGPLICDGCYRDAQTFMVRCERASHSIVTYEQFMTRGTNQ